MELIYNNTKWEYEYERIATPNGFAPGVYVTKLYLHGVTGKYLYDEINGRMTEEDILLLLNEKVKSYETRKYGQYKGKSRKELSPVRSRSHMRYLRH